VSNQTAAAARSNSRFRLALGRFLAAYGLLVMLAVLCVIFTLVNKSFLTFANFKALLEQNSALAIVAVGMTFAIISRNIDLAPGSLVALSGVVIGLVYTATHNLALAIGAGLVAAILVDLFDGVLIAVAGIDPLIVTLAAWIWVRGLAISLTKANSIVIQHPFVDFMNNGNLLGISPPIVLIVLAYIFGWFMLNRTRLGRYTYALGGDERATLQAGINIRRYKILMFGMLGLLAGVAAVVTMSRLGAAAPDAAYGLELDAIVAVIIGGNAFTGGEGSMRRTAFGVLFIAVLNNGLSTLGMRDAYFYALKGTLILLALGFDVLSHRLLKGVEPLGRGPETPAVAAAATK
jgi:ribose/xylose/arabinose/galactoside ABC-type transport system permease subunit